MLLGAVVLVIAIFALRDPKSHVSAGSAAATTAVSSPTGSTGARTASAKPTASATPTRAATSARSSASGSSNTPATTGAKSVPLVVLNNTETAGLAGQAARRFESGGWTVSSTGNLSNNIVSTCAYYDPAITGAKNAAEALREQFPTIRRVKARFAELPNGPVVVVLTPGYSSN